MGGIAPVVALDGRKIGGGTPGPVTGQLSKLLADLTARTGTPVT
jgi:branched-subunit amino acid aminotransferase/4-amino-4-deoxychorismate lyase